MSGNGKYGFGSVLVLSPGLLCEDNDAASAALRCGYQLGLKLDAGDADVRFRASFRWERAASYTRSLAGLGLGYRFGPGDKLLLALDANRSGGGGSDSDAALLLSLRAAF